MIMSSLGLLPILVLILIILGIFRHSGCVISSVLVGGLAWSLFAVIQTQLLSLAGAITFLAVLVSWLFALSIVLFAIIRNRSATTVLKPMTGPDRAAAAVLLAIGAVTLVTALICPPNTWDSLTYHVARVEHWISESVFDVLPDQHRAAAPASGGCGDSYFAASYLERRRPTGQSRPMALGGRIYPCNTQDRHQPRRLSHGRRVRSNLWSHAADGDLAEHKHSKRLGRGVFSSLQLREVPCMA